ncbi:hypothetical protein C2G38_2159979 [Gigaspora rosea]|uniref:Uncharacterized protein n=1 Tax=Gigaspora rosea TaxID=44941 RepID=A0A397VYP5_9GLOM|nr:hypothetical protein C2G38_2159979 [Gigaspora rosea]
MSCNAKFDIKLISKRWYTNQMQLKWAKVCMKNGLVNEFAGLIVKFIENHYEVNANKWITIDINQIENLKKSKHKGYPRLQNSAQQGIFENINTKQDLNKRQDLDLEQDLNSN